MRMHFRELYVPFLRHRWFGIGHFDMLERVTVVPDHTHQTVIYEPGTLFT